MHKKSRRARWPLERERAPHVQRCNAKALSRARSGTVAVATPAARAPLDKNSRRLLAKNTNKTDERRHAAEQDSHTRARTHTDTHTHTNKQTRARTPAPTCKKREKGKGEQQQKKKVFALNTHRSRVVPHHSTQRAQRRLLSQSGRDVSYSTRYGPRRRRVKLGGLCMAHDACVVPSWGMRRL